MLGRVPLGQSPSLHRLRRRLPGLVRRLHRYYETVRLPGLVHRRRASLDFPTRPAAPAAAGEPRTSRFSCVVFPYVPGSSTAQDPNASRDGDAPSDAFRLFLQRRRPELSFFRGSIARPARTPVNASALPLRETPHDSGPPWVASPSTCDSFIHNTPPVYPGAFRNQREPIRSCSAASPANRCALIPSFGVHLRTGSATDYIARLARDDKGCSCAANSTSDRG